MLTLLFALITGRCGFATIPVARLCDLKLTPRGARTFAIQPAELRAPWSADRAGDFAILERAWRDEPSFSRGSYDISLVGSASIHQGSPGLVLERLRGLVDDVLATYAELGFTLKRKVHVFLALNEGEMRADFGGPALLSLSGTLDLNHRGRWRARIVDRTTSFLVIPFDEFGGPLLNRYVIAHELAHAVVQTPSQLLDEATSDWLASVATGETTLRKLPRRRNLDRVTPLRIVRDFIRPTVAHAADLIPRMDRSHPNSTLLSHLFFELETLHGIETVADLVDYLEKNRSEFLSIADQSDQADLTAALPSIKNVRFVPLDGRDLGPLVRESVDSIAALIARWANDRHVPHVETALERRGLAPR